LREVRLKALPIDSSLVKQKETSERQYVFVLETLNGGKNVKNK